MSQSQLAFVFPGQGSQSVSMLAEFAALPELKQTYEEASDALGYDLWKLTSEGPVDELNETHRTQPALLAASTALWRIWCNEGPQPGFLAGHSLGEYSALVAAGVIGFTDAIKLVEQRGQFMQQAVPPGTGKMAAIIGLEDEAIIQACEQAAESEVVSAVNYNSPGQVVIAGNSGAVERAMDLCKEKGAKRALPLPVSVPSHCALMKPAAEQLVESLASISFNEAQLRVVNNVDVKVETVVEKIKDALVRQLYCPVRWTETVQFLATNGVERLYECGPGSVLSGLTKRIDRTIVASQLAKKESFYQSVKEFS